MEVARLRGMLTRRGCEMITPYIAQEMQSPVETVIQRWIQNFFRRNPTVDEVSVDDLKRYVEMRASSNSTDEQINQILTQIDKLHGTTEDIGFLTRLSIEQGVMGKAQAIIDRYHRGDEVDPLEELEEVIRTANNYLDLLVPPERQLSISEAFQEEFTQGGITLRGIPAIEQHVQNITAGDSLGFAGRPGIGKTSSIAAMLTASASEIREYTNDDTRKIHWLQNEGGLNKSRTRVYQSGIRKTREEILELLQGGDGRLEDEFLEATGVPADYFQFTSIAGWDTVKVERYIQDHRPSFVVLDMIQHIYYKGADGEADRIKKLWEWVRLMAIRYNTIVLSTIQVGSEGANLPYPTLDMLYFSKTAVQSAVDVMLVMGFVDKEGLEGIRYYSSVKNKRKVTDMPEFFKAQAHVDLDRCVFDGG